EFVERFSVAELSGIALELAPLREHRFLHFGPLMLERRTDSDDVRASFSERFGHSPPNASLGSCYERSLAIEAKEIEDVHRPPPHSTRIFITSPPLAISMNPDSRPSSGRTSVINRSNGMTPDAASAIASSKSWCSYTRAPQSFNSRQKNRNRSIF